MKKKPESKAPQKSSEKSKAPNIDTRSGATDKSKARSGRGTSNEGTNVSYDEER